MPKAIPKLPALSDSQIEIMEIVWEDEPVSASNVRQTLNERGRCLARNTVRTLLERMEEKGWLKHRQVGRTYWYSATQPRSVTAGNRVVELLNDLCGGSPEALMSALLDYRGLTGSELDRIRGMLDDTQPNDKLKIDKSKKPKG